jgi:hypothetical protein
MVVLVLAACTPDVGTDPVPTAMVFDPEATPPRAPEPTHAIINPVTHRLDFSLAGIPVPADCAAPGPLPRAQCEFLQYLQSLDGYPTVTPARAPAPEPLDPATLIPANVVVIDATTGTRVDEVDLGFDVASNYLTITPRAGWQVGHFYLLGVRGYAHGVRTTKGQEVVAPVPYFLLKQPTSLTCGAATPGAIPESCPAYQLLAQQLPPAQARSSAFRLELLRASYAQLHVIEALAQAGLPREEQAVFWAFATHSNPVIEVNPATGAVPRAMTDHLIVLRAKGMLDGSKLTPTTAGKPGTVTFMDLTATSEGDLVHGLPAFTVSERAGLVTIDTQAPLVAKHRYGIFITNAVTGVDGKPLVASPVSFLLTAQGHVAELGKSQVSGVSDADATALEEGRSQLAGLFDNPLIQAVTGLQRANMAYAFAFEYTGPMP